QGKWVDHGHHALMRIDAYKSVGGYDESFSHNEDAELDTRLIKTGKRIWLTAKTSLIYYPRAAALPLFRQYRGYGSGRVRNLLKHKTKPKLRQMLPVAVFPAFVLALLSPVCFVFALPLLAWAGLCLAYGMHIARKAKDPVLALSGPAAMIMHFAWSLGFWQGAYKAVRKGGA
ncbi:MAG: succinoglycan biosynthesis protein exoa, partial [Proteobacteria bacterium]|nr:succinoglycan biosynthesis protein exoa [Pseudomonadota bacterium]